MQGNRNVLCFHVPGTLAANLDIRWTACADGRIKHISAVASNDSDATIIVGDSGDTNEYLTSSTIGDSQVPKEFDVDDWASTNPTASFKKGDVIVVTIDYDGAGGTAADDLTLVITTLEG
ncbi:MAG: hypothetical protein PVH18_11640 [Chloroflexota bacterium]|jgi:hypothetical protein